MDNVNIVFIGILYYTVCVYNFTIVNLLTLVVN